MHFALHRTGGIMNSDPNSTSRTPLNANDTIAWQNGSLNCDCDLFSNLHYLLRHLTLSKKQWRSWYFLAALASLGVAEDDRHDMVKYLYGNFTLCTVCDQQYQKSLVYHNFAIPLNPQPDGSWDLGTTNQYLTDATLICCRARVFRLHAALHLASDEQHISLFPCSLVSSFQRFCAGGCIQQLGAINCYVIY